MLSKEKYTFLLIRAALGLVFLIFGIDKFFNSVYWASWIPETLLNLIPFSVGMFISLLGIIEVILGLFLLIGFFIRITSIFIILHLVGVIFSIGYSDTAVRDFALLLIAISLLFVSEHPLSIDTHLKNKKKK